jgi:hypothetical protein
MSLRVPAEEFIKINTFRVAENECFYHFSGAREANSQGCVLTMHKPQHSVSSEGGLFVYIHISTAAGTLVVVGRGGG